MRVIRVWSYITANEGFVKRILDYQSFMVTATLAALFVRGVDVVVGTSPQFFTVCAAFLVSRLKRIPFVFELRDLWPESIKAVGAMKESAAIRALERLELFLYRKAARIVSVTHSFKRNLIGRGIDGGKIHVVTNGVDISRFKPQPKDAELDAGTGAGRQVRRRLHRHPRHGARAGNPAGGRAMLQQHARMARLSACCSWAMARARELVAQARHGAGQRGVRRFGAQGAGGALLVAAGCVDHPPAEDGAVHHGDPVEAVRVHGHGHCRCCTGWEESGTSVDEGGIVFEQGIAGVYPAPRVLEERVGIRRVLPRSFWRGAPTLRESLAARKKNGRGGEPVEVWGEAHGSNNRRSSRLRLVRMSGHRTALTAKN